MCLLKVFFIVLIFLNFSCNLVKADKSWKVTEDSIQIDKRFFNSKIGAKSETNKGAFLQSYIKETNQILLFDIASSKIIFSLTPNIDYKKAGRLVQFDIYKVDSVFIITENNIFIINSRGDTIYNCDLSAPLKNNKNQELILWDNENQYPLYFDARNNKLLIRTLCNCSFMDKEYFNYTIEGWFDLNKRTIEEINYSFPEKYRHNSYAQAAFPYRIVDDSLNIISFQSQDSLYVYNQKTNTIKRFPGKSKFQNSEFVPFDTANNNDLERIKEHLIVSPIYQKLLYDPYRQVYYRFFVKEQPLSDSKGVLNSIFNKEVIIMVFNRNLELIDEKNIGNNYSWYFSFVTPRGLYVRRYDTTTTTGNTTNSYEKFSVFLRD